MMAFRLITAMIGLAVTACSAQAQSCQTMNYASSDYAVCKFESGADNVRFYLTHADGQHMASFSRLAETLKADNTDLVFAMNGGMYHRDRRPVGLYIGEGVERQSISTKPGPGNFHLLPNGVFWIERHDDAGETHTPRVASTDRYITDAENVTFATQSGPMLVVDGNLHPKLLKNSTSRKIRNGVGIVDDTQLVFAISDNPVTFYEFATLFRDKLGAENALFLDGTISRLYSKDLARHDKGMPMGPIIAVTEPLSAGRATP